MVRPIFLIFKIYLITSFSIMNTFGQDLEKHKWNNRILIVKTSTINSEKYGQQLKEFDNAVKDLMNRKLILYKIVHDNYTVTSFKNDKLSANGMISRKMNQNILKKEENFEVILIGLDGYIKHQQTEILKIEALKKIIDGMPMRKRENKS